MAGARMARKKTLKVTLVRSTIGYDRAQKDTVRALGLRKLGQSVELPDSASVRGMVAKVKHLVEIDEAA